MSLSKASTGQREVTILELNGYEQLRDRKKESGIFSSTIHVVHTTGKQVILHQGV